MKPMKRVAALLLALLFCVMALPVSAAAEATVTAAKVTAKPGDTIEVPISITHIEDIASIGMHIWYDPAVLKCLDAQMSDVVGAMSMANANTEPKGHPSEVWLTAINAEAVVLDGTVMTITFEVLGDAPAGVSPVKVLPEGLSVSVRTGLREIEVDAVDGSVTVEGDVVDTPEQSTTANSTTASSAIVTTDATQTTAQTTQSGVNTPSQTTVQGGTDASNPSATQAGDVQPSVSGQTVTSPNGETIVLPEETVVDIQGNVVTDASGEPSKVQSVAIMFEDVTAAPDETVTVKVSLSAVAELTALGIAVRYDTDALSFEGGECIGFVKDGAGMTAVVENEKGIVDISATAAQGMSGSGDIAALRFKVKNTAKNGAYRVSVAGDPLLQANDMELPTKIVAGEIRVEGAKESVASGLYAALGVVAVAVIAVVIVWLFLRRKKATASVKQEPAVVDVSGEEDE